MSNLNDLTIKEVKEGLARSAFSVTELVRTCLSRIENTDGQLHAFLTTEPENALASAAACDSNLSKIGKDLLNEYPLFGIPLSLKDLFTTKDLRTTAGYKIN